MKTGFSLCGKTTQGKPCSGPVLALYGIAVSIHDSLLAAFFEPTYEVTSKLHNLTVLDEGGLASNQ